MKNNPHQLALRLSGPHPIARPEHRERELIEALSELLLAVASAEEELKQPPNAGGRDDE